MYEQTTRESLKQKHINSVTAITEVFPEGQKVTAVAIEYDDNIDNSKLSKSTFSVEERTVTRVYANKAAAKAPQDTDGRYVIIELSPEDKNASTIIEVMGDRVLTGRKEVKVYVKQLGDVITTDGKKYTPDVGAVVNDREMNLIVDDFLKLKFKDIKTRETLKYNLFIPKGYDKNKSYPMVVFIADRGPNCEVGELPVIQGLGGVIWATPKEQAKHECFVLVPQYPYQIIFDDYTTTHHADITIDLINSIVNQYNINTGRLYVTGESQGCMLPLELSLRYPDMFTAMLLCSGFWDPKRVPVLAHKKMWVLVSEGDEKSFLRMSNCMVNLEEAGVKISRARWHGRQNAEEAEANARKMIEEGNNIKFVVYEKGTYVPIDENEKLTQGAHSERFHHVHTWRLIYTIETLRDWLFAQKKPVASPSGGNPEV